MRVHRHTPSGNSNTAGRQPGPWGSLQTSSRGCEKGVRAHVQTEPGSAEACGSPSPRSDKGQRLALRPLRGPCADERSPAVAEGGGGSTEHRGLTPAGEATPLVSWAGGRGVTEGADYRLRGILSL